MKKLFFPLAQWALIAGVVALVYWFWNRIPSAAPMTCPQVLLFALALSFVWVEVLKWGVTKPFTCLKCMCGWFALLLAFAFHLPHWYLYLPVGIFMGANYSAVKIRWL